MSKETKVLILFAGFGVYLIGFFWAGVLLYHPTSRVGLWAGMAVATTLLLISYRIWKTLLKRLTEREQTPKSNG